MAEEIDFENRRISNFKGLVSRDLNLGSGHKAIICITHRPLPKHQISSELEKCFVDGRTDMRPILLG